MLNDPHLYGGGPSVSGKYYSTPTNVLTVPHDDRCDVIVQTVYLLFASNSYRATLLSLSSPVLVPNLSHGKGGVNVSLWMEVGRLGRGRTLLGPR